MNQFLFSPIELDQLDQMIQRSVRLALVSSTQATAPEPIDRINFEEACQLLNRGKSWLFKKTMKKEVPFGKFGSRLVFSRKALTEWMQDQIISAENPSEIMARRLAKAATRKSKP